MKKKKKTRLTRIKGVCLIFFSGKEVVKIVVSGRDPNDLPRIIGVLFVDRGNKRGAYQVRPEPVLVGAGESLVAARVRVVHGAHEANILAEVAPVHGVNVRNEGVSQLHRALGQLVNEIVAYVVAIFRARSKSPRMSPIKRILRAVQPKDWRKGAELDPPEV